MRIQTCQADNLAELMTRIKQTYGPTASLMAVRRIAPAEGSHLPFIVEGTVALESPAPLASEFNTTAIPPRMAKKDFAPEAAVRKIPAEPKATLTVAPVRQSPEKNVGTAGIKPLTASYLALVGPAGAGKTTTAAKIAGKMTRLQRKPVGVISTDLGRPGGNALLEAYAAELKVFATTAGSASDLQNRLSRWNSRGPLVIDTRGGSPRDSLTVERMGEMLDSCKAQFEKYLVLSATEHPLIARECLQSYGEIGIKGVILTRIDEAAGIGDCLSEVRRAGLPIVLAGTGTRVPDDLVEPTTNTFQALEISKSPLANRRTFAS